MHSPVCTTGRRKKHQTHTHSLPNRCHCMNGMNVSPADFLGAAPWQCIPHLTRRQFVFPPSFFFFALFLCPTRANVFVSLFTTNLSSSCAPAAARPGRKIVSQTTCSRGFCYATRTPPLFAVAMWDCLFLLSLSLSLSPHTHELVAASEICCFFACVWSSCCTVQTCAGCTKHMCGAFPIEREHKHRPLFWLSFLNNPKQLSKWY